MGRGEMVRRRNLRPIRPSWWRTGTPSAEHQTSLSSPVAPSRRARTKASNVFSGAWARPPRWANSKGAVSGGLDTQPSCRADPPDAGTLTPRLGTMEGSLLLCTGVLVAAVSVLAVVSARLSRELEATVRSLHRFGRLAVVVADLSRSTRRLESGTARLGRR